MAPAAARTAKIPESVETIVLFLLPDVVANRGEWASFRNKQRYMEFGEQQARAYLEGLPKQYHGTGIDVKLFPEEYGGICTYTGSSHHVGVQFHQGARLLPPGSGSMRDCVFIPGFAVLIEAQDQEGTAAILQSAVNQFYVQMSLDTSQWCVRRGDRTGIKEEGRSVLTPYLPPGTEVRTMHADAGTGVYTERVIL
ncbi:MAG: hypothetical protein Q7R76_01440 [Candidatus Woesearchaeota archaeon]|nr:hypothetical protein [Candidatus Woesearchaeota archaeon]